MSVRVKKRYEIPLSPTYCKTEEIGKQVDVLMYYNLQRFVIKSFHYDEKDATAEGYSANREFANILADELLYYLNQNWTEQLTTK